MWIFFWKILIFSSGLFMQREEHTMNWQPWILQGIHIMGSSIYFQAPEPVQCKWLRRQSTDQSIRLSGLYVPVQSGDAEWNHRYLPPPRHALFSPLIFCVYTLTNKSWYPTWLSRCESITAYQLGRRYTPCHSGLSTWRCHLCYLNSDDNNELRGCQFASELYRPNYHRGQRS
jgi:hypothetical protein